MNAKPKFPSEDMARNATRVWYLAKSIKIAMVSLRDGLAAGPDSTMPDLTTGQVPDRHADETGREMLITRPMRARFQDDSDIIWFIVPRSSTIAEHAGPDDPQAALVTFSNGGEGDHIVFDGTITVSRDQETIARLWDSHADIHFPQGPKDSDAILIRFQPRTAHFWTGGQDFVSFAVHYITAKLTGEPQQVGTKGMVMPV